MATQMVDFGNGVKATGKITQIPYETVGRSEEWADNRIAATDIYGRWEDLLSLELKPGDPMSRLAGYLDGWSGSYYIRTASLTREEGNIGHYHISLVRCDKGKNKPFNVTWDVSMEEVQKKLITHPIFEDKPDVRNQIMMWEDTIKAERVKYDKDGKPTYYYQTADMIVQGQIVPIKVTSKEAIAYMDAVMAGIETYNLYLPIIVKTSQYLELPGVDYDADSHIAEGGTISEFTKEDEIGRFSQDLEMKIAGFTKGLWFKSGDKFTMQSDGTWTRTETWTYTNDTRHDWIYTHQFKA